MLAHLHAHIIEELKQSAKTDTVFVVVAVAFNLIALGINWGAAGSSYRTEPRPVGNDVIFVILLLSTLAITVTALRALLVGKTTRLSLLDGLRRLYEDEGVATYYDASLTDQYGRRYVLFSFVVGLLGVVAVLVPLVARLFG